jgi:predicted  nucleic acid-binding Zn-ribbon protein
MNPDFKMPKLPYNTLETVNKRLTEENKKLTSEAKELNEEHDKLIKCAGEQEKALKQEIADLKGKLAAYKLALKVSL